VKKTALGGTVMVVDRKEEKKVAVTLRLTTEENEILNRIKEKYNISKSDATGILIKKYAKEEYGAF